MELRIYLVFGWRDSVLFKMGVAKTKISDFTESVYSVVRRIPRGKVATYAAIARAVGSPRAVRAVGNALNKNSNSYASLTPRSLMRSGATKNLTPCHRVIRSDGSLGGFARGGGKKRELLLREGVVIEGDRVAPGCILKSAPLLKS